MGVVGRMPSSLDLDVLLEFEISNPGSFGKVFWYKNGLYSRHTAAQLEASIDVSKKPVLACVHVDNLACREKERSVYVCIYVCVCVCENREDCFGKE